MLCIWPVSPTKYFLVSHFCFLNWIFFLVLNDHFFAFFVSMEFTIWQGRYNLIQCVMKESCKTATVSFYFFFVKLGQWHQTANQRFPSVRIPVSKQHRTLNAPLRHNATWIPHFISVNGISSTELFRFHSCISSTRTVPRD